MDIGKPVWGSSWDMITKPLGHLMMRSINLSVHKIVREKTWDSVRNSIIWR